MPSDADTLFALLPEFLVAAAAVAAMVGGAFSRQSTVWWGVCTAGIGVAAIALAQGLTAADGLKSSEVAPLAFDNLGMVTRWAGLVLAMLFLLVGWSGAQTKAAGEFFGMLTLVFLGLMLAGVATDIVLLFMSLELISIPTYVLLFLGRRGSRSAEATTKYFFLSIFSSALFLYGLALLYGATGSTQLDAIASQFSTSGESGLMTALLPLAIVFIFAGLGFKIAAVPFHFYAPDVYEATSNVNAGVLAVVPKVAGVVVLIRLASSIAQAETSLIWQIALVLSVLTMTVGNVCALWQNNVRRLMAYSSIAHAGYILIGIAVGCAETSIGNESGPGGFAASFFYVLVYAVASLGFFAALAHLGRGDEEIDRLDQLSGLSLRRPWLGGVMAICMFSLMGIPPLAGFWGKLTLFTGALQTAQSAGWDTGIGNWFVALAIAGALNAAIAAAYYLRVVGTLYFGEMAIGKEAVPIGPAACAALACGVLVVGLGIAPGQLVRQCRGVGQPTPQAGPVVSADALNNRVSASDTVESMVSASPEAVPHGVR